MHHVQLCKREARNAYKIFVCKLKANGWEDNIKVSFRGGCRKGVICIELP